MKVQIGHEDVADAARPGEEPMAASVVLEEVEIFYGDLRATMPLSFEAHTGELVSIVGASGCGKSSALRAIGGLLTPRSGVATVNGSVVTAPRPKEVAYLFQNLALFPWRSSIRNIEIALEFAGVPRRQRRERAEQALETVGLMEFAEKHPAQLSGGMQQRVALARAFASDAGILLFDEPFAALDEHSRMRLGMEVLRMLEAEQKTVIFVTHSLSEAVYLSDRIVVMSPRPGSIVETIDVDLPHPRNGAMMRSPEFHAITDRLTELLFSDKAEKIA
jgi:NitT/TauT family transport system ATP-binding protein